MRTDMSAAPPLLLVAAAASGAFDLSVTYRYRIRLTAKNRCIGIDRKWRTRSNTKNCKISIKSNKFMMIKSAYLPLAKQVWIFLAACLLSSQPLKSTCWRRSLIFNNNSKPIHNEHHMLFGKLAVYSLIIFSTISCLEIQFIKWIYSFFQANVN